jgi:hypothetical protein
LIREFKDTRAVDENTVKLKGFKAYYIDNSPETANHVSFEHYYDLPKE